MWGIELSENIQVYAFAVIGVACIVGTTVALIIEYRSKFKEIKPEVLKNEKGEPVAVSDCAGFVTPISKSQHFNPPMGMGMDDEEDERWVQ